MDWRWREKRSARGVFSIRVNLARQFGPLFQRPNGRWTVMDSACGLLINLGEAIGEPLSTSSKLNKAYPEMTLFSLNSPSAPLSSLDPLQRIKANKMGKFRHCEMMMDIYHTYSPRYIVADGASNHKKELKGLAEIFFYTKTGLCCFVLKNKMLIKN